MKRVLLALAFLAGVFACQNYDFHHVTATPVHLSGLDASITAAAGTPYIMLVEDMSGSMCEPISSTEQIGDSGVMKAVPLADGGQGIGDCAYNLQTDSKIGVVAANLSKALASLPSTLDGGNPYYLGLTLFPASPNPNSVQTQCEAPTVPQVPLAIASTSVPEINSFYSHAANLVAGGTPTAASLAAAASFFPQTSGDARKFILLMTDGLPNCDLLNPCVIDNEQWTTDAGTPGGTHGCMSPNAWVVQHALPPDETPPPGCICSYGSCPDPLGASASDTCCFEDPSISAPGQPIYEAATAECLDADATIGTAAGLYDAGIKIFVIGMGTDFSDFSLLDQVAQAGQGSIDAGHIQADNQVQLFDAISGILAQITQTCAYTLSTVPANPGLIEVQLDGNTLTSPTDYVYSDAKNDGGTGGPEITLVGTSCATVDDGHPHNLTITLVAGT